MSDQVLFRTDQHILNRYGPEETYFSTITGRKGKTPEFPLLLKLHGSLNWWSDRNALCSSFLEPEVREDDFLDVEYRQEILPGTKREKIQCIVPPMPSKPITDVRLFRWIWEKATEYLSEAETIVICGYSLPATDSLANSLFSVFSSVKLKRVVVIDPDASVLQKWNRVFSRQHMTKPTWTWFPDLLTYLAR